MDQSTAKDVPFLVEDTRLTGRNQRKRLFGHDASISPYGAVNRAVVVARDSFAL